MAFTQTDLDNIDAAIARGTKRVRINGEEVEYGSMSELMRARVLIAAEVAGISRSAVQVVYPTTSRGL